MPASINAKTRSKMYDVLWMPNGPNICFYCSDTLGRRNRSIDHLMPRSKGGKNDRSNIVLCCKLCNTLKADMSVAEFVDYVFVSGGLDNLKSRLTSKQQKKMRKKSKKVAKKT